jgi:hypothetical protein
MSLTRSSANSFKIKQIIFIKQVNLRKMAMDNLVNNFQHNILFKLFPL